VATNTLQDLGEAISKLDSHDGLLMLGDFNLHHPLWSTTHRNVNTRIPAAKPLLTIIKDFHLDLLTAPGTTTHRWKSRESTIDLTFASRDVTSRMIHCRVDIRLDHNSDHLLIAVVIDWDWQPATPLRKRLWAKTNLPLLRQTVNGQLPQVLRTIELRDKESINA
jgi:endonuclease/exonuclease/phosphatase family metal-dependent hydrolase